MSKETKYNIRNQKIIETAEKLIKKNGFHHFKMSDISDELDIAKGTIYNHYPSKEELLFVIIFPKMEKLRDSLKKIASKRNPFKKKFQNVIQMVLESDYHQFLLLSFSDMSILFQEKNQRQMEIIQSQIIHEFHNVLLQGVEEGIVRENFSADFLSHQILLTLNPLLHSLLVNDSGKMTHKEYVRQTTELLLYGIQKG